jgi:hypothetical protein
MRGLCQRRPIWFITQPKASLLSGGAEAQRTAGAEVTERGLARAERAFGLGEPKPKPNRDGRCSVEQQRGERAGLRSAAPVPRDQVGCGLAVGGFGLCEQGEEENEDSGNEGPHRRAARCRLP